MHLGPDVAEGRPADPAGLEIEDVLDGGALRTVALFPLTAATYGGFRDNGSWDFRCRS